MFAGRRHKRCRSLAGLRHASAGSSRKKLHHFAVCMEGVTRDRSTSGELSLGVGPHNVAGVRPEQQHVQHDRCGDHCKRARRKTQWRMARNLSLSLRYCDSALLVHCFGGYDRLDVLDALRRRGMLEGARRPNTARAYFPLANNHRRNPLRCLSRGTSFHSTGSTAVETTSGIRRIGHPSEPLYGQ
jgi:hypothetical protein